jgi:endonuclease G
MVAGCNQRNEKMKTLFLTLFLFPLLAFANPINEQCPQFVLRGAPVSSLPQNTTQYICKTNYAVHYRYDTKTAEYVVEHIRLENITGPAKRRNDFRPDPTIPRQFQSRLEDYVGTGYDRGHLSAGANNNGNAQIMSESFFLSNMVPQVPNHNRGIWRILELKIRDWAISGKDLYVITGTAYAQGATAVGPNQVGVPTHMWKVVVDRKGGKGIGFFLPNAPIPVADLPKYVVSIRQIEQYTGINFHPQLPAQLDRVETQVNPELWPGLK